MAQVNVRLPDELYAEAREYDINISQACRKGLQAAVERERKIRELGL